MYIPRVRERTMIDGRRGVFIVLGVDEKNQRAEVVSLASAAFWEEIVAFAMIKPFRESDLEPGE